jgi:hypothetical protein
MSAPIHSSLSQVDFGNEAGDDVPPSEVLEFFVEQPAFHQFLDEKKKILMATAKKGVGKSALIQWIEAKVEESQGDKVIIISCKGSDLVRSNFKLTTQPSLPNEFIQDWKIRICALINRRIGSEIGLAINDDDITLVESSEIEGFKRRNIVTSLTDRFSSLLPAKLKTEKKQVANEIEMLKRVRNRKVWFLVDDLDATYQRTDRENLELSTFFSACRALSTHVTGICFRVTMRTDVWPLIRRYDESLDKFEQYVKDITWSQSEFRSLLAKRVQVQNFEHDHMHRDSVNSESASINQEEVIIAKVFDNAMAWGDKQKPVYQVIYTLSYHRPRWAIQLCKLAQADALRRNQKLINKLNIDTVWGDYGKKRIDDLIVEHKHQCKEVEELINSFRGAPRRVTRDELIDWIKRNVTTHVTPVIEGRTVTTALDIAHFLFRLGFIVARTEREESGYEHYYFSDMPDFLTSRTNKDFGSLWEVHPCYREALDIQKLNANQKLRRDFAR